ncbi:hypothetical protein DJ90_2037 [Paenibacillus macerans]|uniref:Uncharacterized protein n=1 Tax=Paenibacillus macerans TaxID=44252 RepID=A0A090ZNF9_PAEMA|nr:hypothetical protein DJ90_2037 [Paenibacillus macerans]
MPPFVSHQLLNKQREKRVDRDADLKAHILGIHRLRPYFG